LAIRSLAADRTALWPFKGDDLSRVGFAGGSGVSVDGAKPGRILVFPCSLNAGRGFKRGLRRANILLQNQGKNLRSDDDDGILIAEGLDPDVDCAMFLELHEERLLVSLGLRKANSESAVHKE